MARVPKFGRMPKAGASEESIKKAIERDKKTAAKRKAIETKKNAKKKLREQLAKIRKG